MDKKSQIRLYLGTLTGIILISIIFLCFVSAPVLEPIDNTKQIISPSEILIKDKNSTELIRHNLFKNTDQCLTNCYSEGTSTLYKVGKLFDGLTTYNSKDLARRIEKSSYNKILIQKSRIESNKIDDYRRECSKEQNQSGGFDCLDIYSGYHWENQTIVYWDNYNNENLEPGNYSWRTEVIKNIKDNLDWVLSSNGMELSEWAWYNSSWSNKMQININATGTFNLKNIKYSLQINTQDLISKGLMNVSCNDIRFINSSENGEINFMFGNKTDTIYGCNTTNTTIYIEPMSSTTNSTIWMYFNNPSANDGSHLFSDINLRLFYQFDDNSDGSRYVDLSQWKQNGTITGAVNNLSYGTYGYASAFDGTTNKKVVSTVSTSNSSTIFTVMTWVRMDALTGNYQLPIKWGNSETGSQNFDLVFQNNNNLACDVYQGASVSFATITGTWYHVACVSNGTHLIEYINGTLIGSWKPPAYAIGNGNFELSHVGTTSYPFRGLLDNVMVFNTTLTIDEINAVYKNTYKNFTEETSTPSNLAPVVYLNSPANNSNYTTNQMTFNCSATDDSSLLNLSLYINGALNLTVTNSSVGQLNLSLEDIFGMNDGINNYTCNASDGSLIGSNLTYQFFVDATKPLFDNIPNNQELSFGNGLGVDFNASDNILFGYFAQNDSRFSINQSGFLSNISALGANNYYINITINDSSNNLNSTIYNLNITQDNYNCNLSLNVTSPITYDSKVLVTTNCSSSYMIYQNGTSILNNSVQDLSAGFYNFTVIRNDSGNYSNYYQEIDLTVNKAVPYFSISGTTPITYPTVTDIATSESNEGDADLTYSFNMTNATYSVGAHVFNLSTTGGMNYTNNWTSKAIVVSSNTSGCSVFFNVTSPQNYSTGILVYTNCTTDFMLYRNATQITNGSSEYLGVGTYNFTVTRNDSSNYTNYFNSSTFIINKATPVLTFLANGGTSNLTLSYPQQVNISAYNSSGILTLERNGTDVLSENKQNVTLNPGQYIYIANIVGDANYTDVTQSYNITIIDDIKPYFTYIPLNTSIVYPNGFGVNFTATDETTFNLFAVDDNVNFTINSSGYLTNKTTLHGGTYLINVSINDSSNNINFTMYQVDVNKSTPVLTKYLNGIDNNLSIIYLQQVNVSAYTTAGTVNIYRNISSVTSENRQNITLGSGGYQYEFNVTGNENYSDLSSVYLYLTIEKANASLGMSISGTTPITYPTASDFQGVETNTGDGGCVYSLEPTSGVIFGVGNQFFNYSVNGCANYSSSYITRNLTINQNTSVDVYLYLNRSRSNITTNNNTALWINATLSNVIGTINLYNNGTLINSGLSPLANWTAFNGTGSYNITAVYDGDVNYSGDSETWWVNVTTIPIDIISPTWYNLRNFSQEANQSFSQSITANDSSGISQYWLNDSGNFTINSLTGLITNITPLSSVNTYWLNISVNDTSNNINFSIIYINITEVAVSSRSGGGGGERIFIPTKYLCNKTYEYLTSSNYDSIYELSDEINYEDVESTSGSVLMSYISSWQYYCSDLVNKTLRPEFICNEIYIKSVSNNYTINSETFNKIRDNIQREIYISDNLLNQYINKYVELCYLSGYSPKLQELGVLVIVKNATLEETNYSLMGYCRLPKYLTLFGYNLYLFDWGIFEWYIPLFRIHIGENLACGNIEGLRWIFKLKENNNSYYLIGIKAWVFILLLIPLLLILLILFFRITIIIMPNKCKK